LRSLRNVNRPIVHNDTMVALDMFFELELADQQMVIRAVVEENNPELWRKLNLDSQTALTLVEMRRREGTPPQPHVNGGNAVHAGNPVNQQFGFRSIIGRIGRAGGWIIYRPIAVVRSLGSIISQRFRRN